MMRMITIPIRNKTLLIRTSNAIGCVTICRDLTSQFTHGDRVGMLPLFEITLPAVLIWNVDSSIDKLCASPMVTKLYFLLPSTFRPPADQHLAASLPSG